MPRRSTGRLLVCAAWCLLPGCDDAPMMAGEDALAPIDARLPVDADPPDASEADAAVAPDAALGDAPCAADLDFFATRVRPILAIDCADCHLRGGSAPAVGARLALSVPTDLVADFRLLRALAAETVDGESRLRLKPLGELEHGGGPRFAVGDPADVVFVELIARFTDPTCETPPPPAPRPAPPAPLRRLTAIEYARTVRDLFPGVAMPALPLADAPADHGFENDVNAQAPSARLVEQYQQAAFAVAEAVAPHFARLSPCLFVEADCPARFIATLGRRVFRRPLDAAETQRYATFWQAQAADSGHTVAARLTLQAMLQAPAFLYRPEWGAPPVEEGAVGLTGPELATRLSYFLWGSAPDAMLDALADDGRLLDPTVLSEQVDRLLADPRAREQAVDFARQWLRADRLGAVNKDPLIYPEFNDDLRAAMRAEADLFFAHIVFDRAGSVAALLTDATSFVTPALATLYGLEAPAVPVARVALPPEQRAGLLTRAGFLAAHGHFEHPSPVLRGVFVLERLLCAAPPPPMANVDTTPPAPEGFDYPT
ncbi:MAG: DUF1592 domain-containing protein, partial [Myxococcales bacterium]|nr:DUF1592 domain-containing protein [Myxococcales bacterium]